MTLIKAREIVYLTFNLTVSDLRMNINILSHRSRSSFCTSLASRAVIILCVRSLHSWKVSLENSLAYQFTV